MSLYDSTVEMLSLLSEDDLEAVNGIVKRFIIKKDETDSFYKPLTKKEMMDKLAEGRAQIAAGLCEDSETMEKELAEEFGI